MALHSHISHDKQLEETHRIMSGKLKPSIMNRKLAKYFMASSSAATATTISWQFEEDFFPVHTSSCIFPDTVPRDITLNLTYISLVTNDVYLSSTCWKIIFRETDVPLVSFCSYFWWLQVQSLPTLISGFAGMIPVNVSSVVCCYREVDN